MSNNNNNNTTIKTNSTGSCIMIEQHTSTNEHKSDRSSQTDRETAREKEKVLYFVSKHPHTTHAKLRQKWRNFAYFPNLHKFQQKTALLEPLFAVQATLQKEIAC